MKRDEGLDHLEVVERIDDAVLLVSRARLVGWLNPAARHLFDAPDQPVGRPLVEVVRDHRIDSLVARVADTGADEALDILMPVSGRALSVRAAPLASGSGIGLIVRDTTRLRHLETVRQQFVANLSHELRTPLAGLDLAAQTLAAQLPNDAETRVFMERILQESQRLAAILVNLAQLSALDAEQMTVDREPFLVASLLNDLVERYRPRAEAAGLRLSAEEAGDSIAVLGDRAKTDQALQNVVDNALKFTPQGEVVLSANAGDSLVQITVRDTGIGIPPQDLARIFERFYKVDRARGRQVAGTGLGLSIARHLIELQGGKLVAESRPGVGTTLRLFLPRAAPAP
ncbi:MAG: ATP-binding protein [Candidatus Dormibacteria bacterium]